MHGNLWLVYLVFCAAVVSPRPDFFIVLRNALKFGTRAGVLTAAGIAAGVAVHISYCMAGIGLLIARSVVLFTAIKWIGAAYLFYIGMQALKSKGLDAQRMDMRGAAQAEGMASRKALVSGFVTNLFNPKATMFFLALFSQMIDPHTGWPAMTAFAALCMGTVFLWFSGVALVMTVPPLKRGYAAASKWIDRTAGVFFVGLSVRLALSRV